MVVNYNEVSELMKIAVIIPSFCPDKIIVNLVSELINKDFVRICIVNDGSGAEHNEIFHELRRKGGYVIEHDTNRGKGRALKTALENLMREIPDLSGVITADGDGQHSIKDILKVKDSMKEYSNSLILGTRDFSKHSVPFRSKVGNRFSSLYFKAVTDVNCPDTQTGLRGIPKALFQMFIDIEGERYEYEMNFLIWAAREDVSMRFEPIETIYNHGNTSSHFKVISDSIRIYKTPLKYIVASILCAVVDLSAFSILVSMGSFNLLFGITVSTIASRMISGVLNFFLNRLWSFNSRHHMGKQAVRYGVLFISQMFLSGFMVSAFSMVHIPLMVLKIIVDSTLFIISYFVQINWVFRDDRKGKRVNI